MMKVFKTLMLCVSIFVVAGCATRSGTSSKLGNYNEKLRTISVAYKGEMFKNENMNKKLERYNIQKVGQYLLATTPGAFAKAGVHADYKTFGPDMDVSMRNEKQPLLIISPASALTGRWANDENAKSSGSSLEPVKVGFDVVVFDPSINKNVWTADFSLVVGGLLYGVFDEKLTASFLDSIVAKLTDDGLIAKAQP